MNSVVPSAMNFAVLAPFGVVALGALVVLMTEVFLGRGRNVAGGQTPRPRNGIILAMLSSVFLLLSLVLSLDFFVSLPAAPLVFDPANRTDGIDLSADPILLARSAAYSVSYDRRSKGE